MTLAAVERKAPPYSGEDRGLTQGPQYRRIARKRFAKQRRSKNPDAMYRILSMSLAPSPPKVPHLDYNKLADEVFQEIARQVTTRVYPRRDEGLTIFDCFRENPIVNIILTCKIFALLSICMLFVSALFRVHLVHPFLSLSLLIACAGFWVMAVVVRAQGHDA